MNVQTKTRVVRILEHTTTTGQGCIYSQSLKTTIGDRVLLKLYDGTEHSGNIVTVTEEGVLLEWVDSKKNDVMKIQLNDIMDYCVLEQGLLGSFINQN